MKIAYLDTVAGIAGDIMAACLSAGVRLDELSAGLAKLGLDGYELLPRHVRRSSIDAIHVDVVISRQVHIHRTFGGISDLSWTSRRLRGLPQDTIRPAAGNFEGSQGGSRDLAGQLQTPGTSIPQQATVLVGDLAGESEFKRQAGDRQVLHLATHGFFLGGDCGSALAAGADGSSVTRENPLLLSGLVLAGANSSQRGRAGRG